MAEFQDYVPPEDRKELENQAVLNALDSMIKLLDEVIKDNDNGNKKKRQTGIKKECI